MATIVGGRPLRVKGSWLALSASLLAPLSAWAAPPDTPDTDAKRPISKLIDEEFRSDTETRDQSADQALLKERVEQVLENFIELEGYVRSGYGRSGAGGPM